MGYLKNEVNKPMKELIVHKFNDNIEIYTYISKDDLEYKKYTGDDAIKEGNLEFIKLNHHKLIFSKNALDNTITNNRLDILEFLFNNGYSQNLTDHAYYRAIDNKNIQALHWLYTYTNLQPRDTLLYSALLFHKDINYIKYITINFPSFITHLSLCFACNYLINKTDEIQIYNLLMMTGLKKFKKFPIVINDKKK